MRVIIILVSSVLILSCASADKVIAPTPESMAVEEWVNQKNFEVDVEWAYPLTTPALNSFANSGFFPPGSSVGSVNLINNPSFIRMKGDEVELYLPYYGERQLAGEYNANKGGIEFKGVPTRFKIVKNEKKQRHVMTFYIDNNKESSKVVLTFFPNQVVSINVNSSHRTPISYRGTIEALKESKVTGVE